MRSAFQPQVVMPSTDMIMHNIFKNLGHRMKKRPESALADAAAMGFLKQGDPGNCDVLFGFKRNLNHDLLF